MFMSSAPMMVVCPSSTESSAVHSDEPWEIGKDPFPSAARRGEPPVIRLKKGTVSRNLRGQGRQVPHGGEQPGQPGAALDGPRSQARDPGSLLPGGVAASAPPGLPRSTAIPSTSCSSRPNASPPDGRRLTAACLWGQRNIPGEGANS